MRPGDFLNFVQHLDSYLTAPFIDEEEEARRAGWPVARLAPPDAPPIRLQLQHYKTMAEAEASWKRRAERINRDRIVLLHTDKAASPADLQDFEALPFPKIVFTHRQWPDLPSSCFVPGFESAGEVGDLFSEWTRLGPVLTARRLSLIR